MVTQWSLPARLGPVTVHPTRWSVGPVLLGVLLFYLVFVFVVLCQVFVLSFCVFLCVVCRVSPGGARQRYYHRFRQRTKDAVEESRKETVHGVL